MYGKDVILSAQTDAAKAMLPLITRKGVIRASKPTKDGNAAYVWRMVAFSVSRDPKQHCMPMTADFGVEAPEDWNVEAPADWMAAERARCSHPGYFQPDQVPADMDAFLRTLWTRNSGFNRRRHYIKTVLDPIVDEIVKSVPPRSQAGTQRWARAFGVV